MKHGGNGWVGASRHEWATTTRSGGRRLWTSEVTDWVNGPMAPVGKTSLCPSFRAAKITPFPVVYRARVRRHSHNLSATAYQMPRHVRADCGKGRNHRSLVHPSCTQVWTLGTAIRGTTCGRYGSQEMKTAQKCPTSGRKWETRGKIAHVGPEMGNFW